MNADEQATNEIGQLEEIPHETDRQRFIDLLENLLDKRNTKESVVFPSIGTQGDSTSIEGHQIDIVGQGDRTVVYFKLTANKWTEVLEETIPQLPQENVTKEKFTFRRNLAYPNANTTDEEYGLSSSFSIQLGEKTKISVSRAVDTWVDTVFDVKSPKYDEEGNYIGLEFKKVERVDKHYFAMQGAVKIEVNDTDASGEIVDELEAAFKTLGIHDAFSEPDAQILEEYSTKRLRWHHKLDTEDELESFKSRYKEENGQDILERLEFQEVFPGYRTVVEPGAHERYEQAVGPYVIFMRMYTGRNIANVMRYGVLSSAERYRRGILVNGDSTKDDFQLGGADSVFLRLYPAANSFDVDDLWLDGVRLIFNPSILNRTDWYAYGNDKYGSTEAEDFRARLTPEVFFQGIFGKAITKANELMFRKGIPAEMINAIVVPDEYYRDTVLSRLRIGGFHEIQGKPVEEFVHLHDSFGSLRKSLCTR